MATKLTFSIMTHMATLTTRLEDFLAQYAKSKSVDASLVALDYATGWQEFVRNAIHGSNLHVSEVGSTWLNDFIAMNALRPFHVSEVKNMGGAGAFAPGLWKIGVNADQNIFAIPWMTDIRFVYYRRSQLAQAKIDPEIAFSTIEQFDQTMQALQASGGMPPLALPTQKSHLTLHNLGMWIWSVGKDYLDESGKRVLLMEPDVQNAMRAYFNLGRFLTPGLRKLADQESDAAFIEGRAAVALAGPWMLNRISDSNELAGDTGIAIPFQQPYMGGSSLVIWKNVIRDRESAELVNNLASRENQAAFAHVAGQLPARMDTLDNFPLPDPSFRPVIDRAFQNGRTLPNLPLWGMIEERMVNSLARVWADLMEKPESDAGEVLNQHLKLLTNRLNLVLSNS